MRVGIDARALQPGYKEHFGRGIGLYAAELIPALAALGELELTLFADRALPLDPARVPPGATLAWYPFAGWRLPARAHWSTQLAAPLAYRRAPLDVFHVLAHVDAPALGAPRVVVTVHDLILDVLGDLYRHDKPLVFRVLRAFDRAAIRRATRLVTDSAATREDVVRVLGIPRERIDVAHLGIDARYRPRDAGEIDATLARLGVARPYLLYVGGIDARKNAPGLVRAYARACGTRADLPPLVFAGGIANHPAFPPLEQLVRALGLAERVRVLGYVPDDALPALLSGAELFAFPSVYEGFGLPPLEAMACGVPVVATHAGSLAEVLGDAAEIVAPNDDAALAAALLQVLGSPSRAAELRVRGRERAARFTWDACARATLAAYRAVASGAGRR